MFPSCLNGLQIPTFPWLKLVWMWHWNTKIYVFSATYKHYCWGLNKVKYQIRCFFLNSYQSVSSGLACESSSTIWSLVSSPCGSASWDEDECCECSAWAVISLCTRENWAVASSSWELTVCTQFCSCTLRVSIPWSSFSCLPFSSSNRCCVSLVTCSLLLCVKGARWRSM